jgi:hypothetical protein
MWYAIAKPNLNASKKSAPRVRNTPVDKNDKNPGIADLLVFFDLEGEVAPALAFSSGREGAVNGFTVHESSPAAIAAADGPPSPFKPFGLPAEAARFSSAAAAVADAAGGVGKVCSARKVTTN